MTWEVMSAKHDKVKTKQKKIRAKGQTEVWGGKIAAVLFVLTPLTSMSICKVRVESVSKTAPSKKQCSPSQHLYPIHFYVRPGSCKFVCDMGFWDIWCRRGMLQKCVRMLQKCVRMLLSVCK
jgi:hypothetical protein